MGKRRGTLLLLTGLVSLFCWAGCGRQEGERLKDYGIYRVEGEDSMVLTQFVMDLAQEKTDIKLKNVPGDQENWISLISHEESANEYGYTVERMDDNAFTIVRNEGHLFFLARTDQGMERACRYFFGNLVERVCGYRRGCEGRGMDWGCPDRGVCHPVRGQGGKAGR